MSLRSNFTLILVIACGAALFRISQLQTLNDPPDPSVFCSQCWERREQKPFYANPENCSTYYQCFKNRTGVEGILRPCPTGSRFAESIMACVPKWDGVSCDDPCENSTIMMDGWWMKDSDCGIFYQCSNYYSIKMCCPPNHRFNMSWGDCMYDKSCNSHNEECRFTGTVPMWTPEIGENGTCRDLQYGVTRQLIPGNPHMYKVILTPYKDTVKEVLKHCPLGTLFVQETCKCSNHTDVFPVFNKTRDCLMELNCDKMPIIDSTKEHVWVNNQGNPKVTVEAFGRGIFDPGVCDFTRRAHLEIPFFQGNSLRDSVTISFWVNIQGDCPAGTGGIMSNGGEMHPQFGLIPPSVLIYHTQEDELQTIVAQITTLKDTLEVKAKFLQCNTWYLINVIYHHGELSIWINCVRVDFAIGTSADIFWMSYCPLAIGHDHGKGYFTGQLDNIIICREKFSTEEMCLNFGGPPPDEGPFEETNCERMDERLTIQCPAGHVIDIESAFYGRENGVTCAEYAIDRNRFGTITNHNCPSAQAARDAQLATAKSTCNSKNSCTLDALNNFWGDPCGGTYKYQTVVWNCIIPFRDPTLPPLQSAINCERMDFDLNIQCPAGLVIDIESAFYGRQDGVTCAEYATENSNLGSINNHNCPSTQATIDSQLQKAKTTCNGAASCQLSALNAFWGDPCGGTYKYQSVSWRCV